MKRRKFLRYSALASLPVLLQNCYWPEGEKATPFTIQVHSDAKTGHLIRKSASFPASKTIKKDTIIVGGGIAGIAAAYTLEQNQKEFLLFELSGSIGGSSSAYNFETTNFSQGAHYDLAYPENYGKEVLDLLSELDIIEHQPWKKHWSFKDEKHLILNKRKNQCYDNGIIRKDVLTEGPEKEEFLRILFEYKQKMLLPTRLIAPEIKALDNIDFASFLKSKMELSSSFKRGIDYHMKDDYGANSEEVSALAGIHYFMCRPYYDAIVPLFSPPEGNAYFLHKMMEKIQKQNMLTSHLVKNITKTKDGFTVSVIDIAKQEVLTIEAKNLIYAGQKHALQYIFPSEYPKFKHNKYAPWMVINIVLSPFESKPAFWQNEMLTEDCTFMGFIDSGAQHTQGQKHRVLTAYYCLPEDSRKDLLQVEKNKNEITLTTITRIEQYFQTSLIEKVQSVHIKVMGHAMPIPYAGYLSDNAPFYSNLAYAGVDTGRLPLFFEAMDSGIQAANHILDNDNKQ